MPDNQVTPEIVERDISLDGGRIPELEGLRAVLAWIVVAAHVLICSGWFGPSMDGISVLSQVAEAAVDVFMLLSGFAITRLLLVEQEPFKVYLWRRFLRIVPAYWVALAAAIALNNQLAANLAHLPATLDRDGMIMVCQLGASRWWIDIPLHVALLHGFAPSSLLPWAPYTFLGAAWSLSLEWQFYCVAPFALMLAMWNRVAAVLLISVAAISTAFAGPIMSAFSDAFLPAKIAFFVVGGISYFAVCRMRARGMSMVTLAVPILILALIWWRTSGRLIEAIISGGIWVLVVGSVRLEQLRALREFLNCRLMQYLGRVSYSTYLFHAPVITLVQAAIWRWFSPHSMAALIIGTFVSATAGTLLVSAMSWRFIEAPFQKVGRRGGAMRSRSRIHGAS
ncbi:MAG: acyltransferase [Verrucomicrobiota bacterium]|nr:acyltransferase [Verrucomicrobiota bacterium]